VKQDAPAFSDLGHLPGQVADLAVRAALRAGPRFASRFRPRLGVKTGANEVFVRDLGSRNGTTVRIPGRPPQKLRVGEPTPVLVGTVIDFGGGFELNVRED